ncbi:MAG: hypothetical protein IKY16_06525 [Bacteroidales bacterium]|nr:hypothetical protein [Bacteroidales bacterium]
MAIQNLLYKHTFPVNDYIQVVVPSVGQVLECEDSYYHLVTVFTAMPIDLMVPLSDAGIDFTKINEYELFLLLFPGIQKDDTSLILGDLDLSKFHTAINEQNGKIILEDSSSGIKIDRSIHSLIASALRKMHHLEKNRKKPANEETKKYMIERAKAKAQRRNSRTTDSELESLIVSMVNTEQYKYDFEGTRELSIYQFNECVRQVIKKVDYDNRMYGIYSGTISAKEMSQDDLNWLSHK